MSAGLRSGIANIICEWDHSNSSGGRPLGTDAGISLRRFLGFARSSRSPFATKSRSCWNSASVRRIGVESSGSTSCQYWLDRSLRRLQIRVEIDRETVIARRGKDIQMVPDRVFQPRKAAVMEESGLQRDISYRRRPEPYRSVAFRRDLLQAEILICTPGRRTRHCRMWERSVALRWCAA